MKRPKHIPEFADIPAERVRMPELELEERRLNFREVELGFTEEMARREAARCLSCRRCIGCGLCLAECEKCAVVYDQQAGEATIRADAVIFAADADPFPAGRKRELGYAGCADVITSVELDRLFSADGPFGGLVVRPFDGEVPRRIAFIQCVGSRDESIGANYCSVECCSRTISQAGCLRGLITDAEVTVFHRGLRPAGKTGEIDLKRLEGQPWVSLVEAAVTSVVEDPATGAVTVRHAASGKEEEASFDLVVLAVGLQARRDFRRYARAGGAAVTKYGFVDSGIPGLLACKEGVAYAGTILGPEPASQVAAGALAAATRALGEVGDGGRSGPAATAVVVGGGAAGLAAAAELLRRGVRTVIVEKSGSAGGSLGRMTVAGPGDPGAVENFARSVEGHPHARLLTAAEVASVERAGGGLRVTVSSASGREAIEAGALVIATGAGPYIPHDWRAAADPVITQDQLACALGDGAAPWKKVVMLQCVGARDEQHPYCSRFCCRQALTNALAFKREHPDAEITVLHRGIRVFGADEDLYTDAVERGVKFVEIRGAPTMEEGEPFKVHGRTAGGDSFRLECDLAVLSVAASDNREIRRTAAAAGAALDDLGFVAVRDPLADPFAAGAAGVFVCGSARGPVTVEEAFAEGAGAAGAVCSYLNKKWAAGGPA